MATPGNTWSPKTERSGLSASPDTSAASGYDPRDILRRVRSARSFSERFDSFSEIYVWVLAAMVALAYLASALYGAIFVLLGEGVPHLELASARWSLDAVALFLLPMLLLLVFRLMLYLGPNAVGPEQADWWLPLPVDRRVLLRPAWRRALGLGSAAGVFLGLLWALALFALAGTWSPALLLSVVGFFALAGLDSAAAAGALQAAGRQHAAQRFCSAGLRVLAAGYVLLWTAQLVGMGTLDARLVAWEQALLEVGPWMVLCCGALAVAVPCIVLASRRLAGVSGAALREGGLHQQQLAGAIMQADARGVHLGAARKRNRTGGRLVRALPVSVGILALRCVRGGHWKPALGFSAAALVLLLSVRTAANPLALAGVLAILLVVLGASLAEVLRPAATQPELGLMLGLARSQRERAMTAVAAGLSLLVLGVWTLGLWGIGALAPVPWWSWVAAVLLAALGLASVALAHARRAERDWEEIFAGASNEMSIAAVLIQQAWTLLRAAASGAALYFQVLAPDAAVPWGIWAVCLLGAAPALKKLAG